MRILLEAERCKNWSNTMFFRLPLGMNLLIAILMYAKQNEQYMHTRWSCARKFSFIII